MRKLIIVAALAVASVAMSGCLGLPLGGKPEEARAALHDFLMSPNCAHDDEAEFVSGAGGVPASFRAKVQRHCEAQPLAAGQVLAPASSTPTP